jgi:hypothetical protein
MEVFFLTRMRFGASLNEQVRQRTHSSLRPRKYCLPQQVGHAQIKQMVLKSDQRPRKHLNRPASYDVLPEALRGALGT